MKTALPRFIDETGLKGVESVIQSTLSDDFAHKNLEIHCNSDEVSIIQGVFAERGALEGVAFIPKDTVKSGGCTIAWDNGGVLYDPGTVAQDVVAILEQALEDHGVKRQNDGKEDAVTEKSYDTMGAVGPEIASETGEESTGDIDNDAESALEDGDNA